MEKQCAECACVRVGKRYEKSIVAITMDISGRQAAQNNREIKERKNDFHAMSTLQYVRDNRRNVPNRIINLHIVQGQRFPRAYAAAYARDTCTYANGLLRGRDVY